MKLHEIIADADTFVKRVNEKEYKRYTTKENKTYLMEEFFPIEESVIKIQLIDGTEEELGSYDWIRVVTDGWEMLVLKGYVNFLVNLSK